MNSKLQSQLDAQIEKKRTAQVVEASEAPSFSPDIFEHDQRETARVEINFKDMSARLVEASDAPKVTREVLETLGKPVKTVEFFYQTGFFQAAIRDGIPTELEIRQLKLLMEYPKSDAASVEKRNLETTRMLLSEMLVDPAFSYQGKGQGLPIETRSQVMLNSLSEAFRVVNTPQEDAIFQVAVRRGLPEDKFTLFGEFEWYPVGKAGKKYTDMSEEELSAEMARNRARRQVLVPAMIVDPKLTWTRVEDGEVVEVPEDADAPYPVELLSERFMRTFNEAHKVVTTPEAGLKSLQRFLRSDSDESESEAASSESVGAVQGRGDKTGE